MPAWSLLTLALTSRLEREWSRRSLAALSVAVVGGMLFSDAVAFVGRRGVRGLCSRFSWPAGPGAGWRRRSSRRGTAVLMLGVYKAFDARAVVPGLTSYWGAFYLPAAEGLHADIARSWPRTSTPSAPISVLGRRGWGSRWS